MRPATDCDACGPRLPLVLASVLLLWAVSAAAETSIAILDFELRDLTLLAGAPEEIRRTASIRPQVEQALKIRGGYQTVPVEPAAIERADQGIGYLYDHPDAAANLGRSAGDDWILVGRLHKPSFLFAYLVGRLVETRSGQVVADLVVEAKGQTGLATERGAARLAEQTDRAIGAHRIAAPTPAGQ
jgi:hypothetical protein